MRRYYLSPIVGTGKENDPYRPLVAEDGYAYAMIDLRPASTKPDGVALVNVGSDSVITKSGVILLTDYINDKAEAIKAVFNSKMRLNLESVLLPDLIAELLIHPQHAGFCKPVQPMSDGKYRIYLGGLIWGPPEPKYKKGTITESFNTGDSDTLGPDLSWTEYGDIDIVSNAAQAGQSSASYARAETSLSSTNMYAQVKLGTWVDTGVGNWCGAPAIRFATASNDDLYWAQAEYYDGWSPPEIITIHKRFGASSSRLAYEYFSHTQDDIIKMTADGSALKSYSNNVEKVATTDSDVTGQVRAGIRFYLGSSGYLSNVALDAFEAGGLTPPAAANPWWHYANMRRQ